MVWGRMHRNKLSTMDWCNVILKGTIQKEITTSIMVAIIIITCWRSTPRDVVIAVSTRKLAKRFRAGNSWACGGSNPLLLTDS